MLDSGEKGRGFMRNKIEYTDEPMGKVKVVADFLPPPEEFAFRDNKIKVTLFLSEYSVEFFKRAAKRYNTKYQKMIRSLLDEYAHKHSL